MILEAAALLYGGRPPCGVLEQFGQAITVQAAFETLEASAWKLAADHYHTYDGPVSGEAKLTTTNVEMLLAVAPPGGGDLAERSHVRLLEDFKVPFEGSGSGVGRVIAGTMSPEVLTAATRYPHSDADLHEAVAERAAELVSLHALADTGRAAAAEDLLIVMAHRHCGSAKIVAAAIRGCNDSTAVAEAVLDGCREPVPDAHSTQDCPQLGLRPEVASVLLSLSVRCPQAVVDAAGWHPVTAQQAAQHPLATPAVRSAAASTRRGPGRRTVLDRPVACGRVTGPHARCGRQTGAVIDGDWCGRCLGLPTTHRYGWTPRMLPDDYVPLAAGAAAHEGRRLAVVRAEHARRRLADPERRARLDTVLADTDTVSASVADPAAFRAALMRVAAPLANAGRDACAGRRVAIIRIGGHDVLVATDTRVMVLDYTSTASAAPVPALISPEAAEEIISQRLTLKAVRVDHGLNMFYQFGPGCSGEDPTLQSMEQSDLVRGAPLTTLIDCAVAAGSATPVDLPTGGIAPDGPGMAAVFDVAAVKALLRAPRTTKKRSRTLIEIDASPSGASMAVVVFGGDGPITAASVDAVECVGQRRWCDPAPSTVRRGVHLSPVYMSKILSAAASAGTGEMIVGVGEPSDRPSPAVVVVRPGCAAVLAPVTSPRYAR